MTVTGERQEIRATLATEGFENAARVRDRPIGYHRMEESVYSQRRNPGEAAYIAEMVRGLFAKVGTPDHRDRRVL